VLLPGSAKQRSPEGWLHACGQQLMTAAFPAKPHALRCLASREGLTRAYRNAGGRELDPFLARRAVEYGKAFMIAVKSL
jgi:hypothetical protein